MSTLADFRLPRAIYRMLAKLSVVICPEAADLMAEREVVVRAELFMRSLSPAARWALVAGSLAFEKGATLRYGRAFSQLERAQAEHYFASWWDSRNPALRGFAKGVKSMLALSFYEIPAVKELLAYRPKAWIEQVTSRRQLRWSKEIAEHEQVLRQPLPLSTRGDR